MAKRKSLLFPVLAISASFVGFMFAKWHMEPPAGLPMPPEPTPDNYSTVTDPFDLANYIARAREVALEGNAIRGVVVLSGLSEQAAIALANRHPDVEVVWAPAGSIAEAFDLSTWVVDIRMPWVLALAIPTTGDTEGEPVAGSVATNEPYFEALFDYARTGQQGDM